jgi:hypothetical protein
LSSSDDPLLGRSIAQFRVRSRLGQGGMGAVYRAEDTRLRRDVALKVLPIELTFDPERRARLLREARSAAAVTHPNVATVYEAGETEGGLLWIAMELVDGESLRARLSREKRLSVEDALRIAGDVAAAVGRAHERGIVHRDIKPENVMLDHDGHVKVLDFGLAKASEMERPQGEVATGEVITREGAILGTPEYMAPEQARGAAADARTDVFAIGVMLHEMIAGERPFTGTSALQVIAAILTQDPPALAGAPAEVAALCLACMARDPEPRPRDGRALASAIARARTPSSARPSDPAGFLPTLPSDRGIEEPRAREKTRWWIAAAIGAPLVAITAAAWMAAEAPADGNAPRAVPSGPAEARLERLTAFGSSTAVRDIALSPDGRTLALGFGEWVELRAVGGGETRRIRAPSTVWGVAFDGSSDRVAVTLGVGRLVLLGRDGTVLEERNDTMTWTRSPDGSRVATMSTTGELWLERDGERRLLRRGFSFPDVQPEWSPDGETIALIDSNSGASRIAIVSMDREVEQLPPMHGLHQGYTATSIRFDREGCLLFFLSEPAPAAVLHRSCRGAGGWSDPEPLLRVPGGAVTRFVLAEDALYLLVAVRQIDLWTAPIAADGAVGPREPLLQTDVDERDPAWLADGSLLFQVKRGGRWVIDRIAPGARSAEPFIDVEGHATFPEPDADGNVWFFSLPAEGGMTTLARRAPSGEIVRLREVGRRQELPPTGRPPPRDIQLTCAEAVPRRCLLIERDEVGSVVSWLDPSGAPIPIDIDEPAHFVLSPDGATLGAASVQHGLRFFDASAQFQERPPPTGAPQRVQSLAFAPSGTRLVLSSVGDHRQALVVSFDLTTGALTTVFDGGVNWLQGPAIDRRGTRLAGGEMFVIADAYRVALPDWSPENE